MKAKSYKLKYTPNEKQLIKELSVRNGECWANEEEEGRLSIIIKAIEKQIPKKPLHMHKNYYCPICKEDGWMLWDDAIPNDMDGYCDKCGQAIDWSDCRAKMDLDN